MRTLGTIAGSTTGETVLLFDDFTGASIDETKWTVYNRIGDMVNRDYNCCVPANIRVTGGRLLVDAKHENYTCQDWLPASDGSGADYTFGPTVQPYTSGQVDTKLDFLYGTVIARAKMPNIGGVWPCIWMLGSLWHPTQPYTANTHDGAVGWPGSPGVGWWEIDIAEFMDNARLGFNACIHYNTAGGGPCFLTYDARSRFMTYKVVWGRTVTSFYVDEEDGNGFRKVQEYTGGPSNIPDTPGYVTINMSVADKGGSQIPANYPLTMEVDYVKITQP